MNDRRRVLEDAVRRFIDEGRLRWAQMNVPGVIDPAVAGEFAVFLDEALSAEEEPDS